MPTSKPRPPVPTLSVPPTDESATFQHVPDGPLKREWEPGCQPDEVYDRVLPGWRAAMRNWLVRRLRDEKDTMAKWQAGVRTTGRDTYFYWTTIFGTHTFFVALLPMFFFFHNPIRGRGLLYIVSLGVYISSFAKDLVCTPRPYSPPMIRLSMSTHHNEYGFPSSHSTNAVSIALFFAQILYESRAHVGLWPVALGFTLTALYMTSVVGGRLYTGMHSTADVIAGILMGLFCWAFWIFAGDASEAWVNSGTIWVPVIIVPTALALVHFHPEPVDDCPCFEDAIAVLSCSMGSFVGHWQIVSNGVTDLYIAQAPILDHGLLGAAFISLYRVILGLGIMVVFRIIAKSALLFTLPPVFRRFAELYDLDLTTRRFYKAATDYKTVPQPPIFTVPSVLDLHAANESPFPSANNTAEVSITSSANNSPLPSSTPSPTLQAPSSKVGFPPAGRPQSEGLRHRGDKGKQDPLRSDSGRSMDETYGGEQYVWVSKRKRISRAERAKYDAEVLTKVGVYAGLGYLATTPIPLLFGYIEGLWFG